MTRTALLVLLLSPTLASARTDWMNPGEMGANAVPSFAIEAPWTNDYTTFQLGAQLAQGWRYDTSFLPYFRLITPFGKWISTYFEGSIVEFWWSSAQTREEWGLVNTQGIAKADLRFGFKLLLADLGEELPKVGFRAFTKTTTGKGFQERRFTDSPGYLMEFLVGEKFPVKLKGLELQALAMGGYWIWQQGEAGQNDCLTWGLAVNTRVLERLSAQVELRGYVGWQKNDKPVILSTRLGVLFTSWFELIGSFNVGFVDAPRFEGILTLSFRLPSVAPLLFDFFSGPDTRLLKHHE